MFTLLEELLLLCIHETKGSFIGSTVDRLKPGLAGAILAELALMGRIQATNNHRLQLIDDTPTNAPIIDEVLGALKESDKDRKFYYWLNTLNQKSEKIREHVVDEVIKKGAVTQDDDRLAWSVPSPLHADSKGSTKYEVLKRLRGIVLAQEEAQPRDIVLLSLVRSCGLLYLVFLRDEAKYAECYIYELFMNQALKDSAIQTVQEIDAAIASAVEED